MPIYQTKHMGLTPVPIFTSDIQHEALQQLHNIADLTIVHPHIMEVTNSLHTVACIED